ncbi:MAG: elongation factor G [Planctomycetes bacterium]|nr:elongation factor G [Planctomycetota bacterium]
MAQVIDVRTFALVGPADSGKTTLAESLAHAYGAITRKGSVADGTTVADYEPEEKEKKHSFQLAVLHLPRKNGIVEMIDTPGYPEFIADAIAGLSVVETAAICIPAVGTIPFHARTMWGRAEAAGVARAIVVTKMDHPNVELDTVLEAIQSQFGDRCVPVTLPNALGPNAKQVVDVLRPAADADAGLRDRAAGFYATFVERVVEADEKLMESYLESGSVAPEVLEKAIARAMVAKTVVPVFFVNSATGLGIPELARFVELYFPRAVDFGAHVGVGPDGKEVQVSPSTTEPFAGFVFKTVTDKAIGEIHYVRVTRGTLDHDLPIADPHSGKPLKIGGILTLFGKDRKPTDHCVSGQLIAISKMQAPLHFGDTLLPALEGKDRGVVFHFKKPELPKPTVSWAIEPKRREDEGKIAETLRKIVAEDPSLHLRRDATTHELIIEGLSDLQINTQLHRLHRMYGVEVSTHLPKIAYKEAIRGKAEGHYRHKKQSGGRGQFGEIYCRVEPRERGAGFEFVDDVVGGSVPRQFLPAVEKGMRSVLEKGIIAGCEVIDVSVSVYDGKYHEVDSDGISFEIAGRNAFKDAFIKAKPILLEPIMDVTIVIPQALMGAVIGDLNTRRGRIMGMDSVGDQAIVKAQVPLKELQQYTTQLRSVTAGEGSFTLEFSHYDQVPSTLQEQIVSEWAAAHGHKAEE